LYEYLIENSIKLYSLQALAVKNRCIRNAMSSNLSADSLRQAHSVFAATAAIAAAQQQMPGDSLATAKGFKTLLYCKRLPGAASTLLD
jgi:hypothetical protein